jgi:hypothetical protein
MMKACTGALAPRIAELDTAKQIRYETDPRIYLSMKFRQQHNVGR